MGPEPGPRYLCLSLSLPAKGQLLSAQRLSGCRALGDVSHGSLPRPGPKRHFSGGAAASPPHLCGGIDGRGR